MPGRLPDRLWGRGGVAVFGGTRLDSTDVNLCALGRGWTVRGFDSAVQDFLG